MWRAAWAIWQKDVALEWRSRTRVYALASFGLSAFLLFSFAAEADTTSLRRLGGGLFWLAMLLSSVLALGESMRVETHNRALEAVLLSPANPHAVFVGKALANTVFLTVFGLALVPVATVLFDLRFASWGVGTLVGLAKFAAVIVLGSAALSAPGTLLAAMAQAARSKDLLLPVLMFPLLVPVLLCTTRASSLVLHGDAMGDIGPWLVLLTVSNVVYWGLGFILFPVVIEE